MAHARTYKAYVYEYIARVFFFYTCMCVRSYLYLLFLCMGVCMCVVCVRCICIWECVRVYDYVCVCVCVYGRVSVSCKQDDDFLVLKSPPEQEYCLSSKGQSLAGGVVVVSSVSLIYIKKWGCEWCNLPVGICKNANVS